MLPKRWQTYVRNADTRNYTLRLWKDVEEQKERKCLSSNQFPRCRNPEANRSPEQRHAIASDNYKVWMRCVCRRYPDRRSVRISAIPRPLATRFVTRVRAATCSRSFVRRANSFTLGEFCRAKISRSRKWRRPRWEASRLSMKGGYDRPRLLLVFCGLYLSFEWDLADTLAHFRRKRLALGQRFSNWRFVVLRPRWVDQWQSHRSRETSIVKFTTIVVFKRNWELKPDISWKVGLRG